MATIEAVLGDITTQAVDAIVNAANSALLGGGGVDGAIHAAAGPRLLAECRELRRTSLPDGLPVGEAVATGAGDLAARWVIHTVGPNRHRGETDPDLLASCFRRSLQVARAVGASSVAFPAVSAGIYGWDPAEVAQVAVGAVRSELGVEKPGVEESGAAEEDDPAGDRPGGGGAGGIELVRFVLFSRSALSHFEAALAPGP
jgi:O-acetyl-ADP-ribose deacetylase (regulator of RNase III)